MGNQRKTGAARSRAKNRRVRGRRAAAGKNTKAGRPAKNRRRKRRGCLIAALAVLVIIAAAAAAGIGVIWMKYGPSDEEADLEQYYGIDDEGNPAAVIDNEVVTGEDVSSNEDGASSAAPVIAADGQYYLEYSVVTERVNARFYWDSGEHLLLYTLPEGNVEAEAESTTCTVLGESETKDYIILKESDGTAYIALPFLQEYTDMEYAVYEEPNRVVITTQWENIQTAVLKKKSAVRYQGGVKSPILTKAEKSEQVILLEEEGNWTKIATEDGFIGYVRADVLGDIQPLNADRDFTEPSYTSISKDYTINMAWHNVSNKTANDYIESLLADADGLTTVAPTWFNVEDTDGNLTSIGEKDYVTLVHNAGLEVWAVLRDFHGGISSYEETLALLSSTTARSNLIEQVIDKALALGVDGINLDFELVSSDCAEHYVQFVRELSAACRNNGLVYSVDTYVPQSYNTYYNIEEQGTVADYVIIMAYDEHTEGSYEAGSVSSISYVTNGISTALESVSADKLIVGLPFYTRLWLETEKTEGELAEEAGTEAAEYGYSVTSEVLKMSECAQAVADAGAEASWDAATQQNYAEWTTDEGTYKIWLEDTESLEAKLAVMADNSLAGVAEWSLGLESDGVWELIAEYTQ